MASQSASSKDIRKIVLDKKVHATRCIAISIQDNVVSDLVHCFLDNYAIGFIMFYLNR